MQAAISPEWRGRSPFVSRPREGEKRGINSLTGIFHLGYILIKEYNTFDEVVHPMPANIQSIFVNLPVKDLKKSIEFFSRVGFTFDERFTDDNATCMIIGPNMYAMLLNTSFFGTFTEKEIVDASKSAETIVALSVGSREEVDDIANKALEAGGSPSKEAADHGFMYTRSFQDVDGHIWEVFHMDMSAFPQE